MTPIKRAGGPSAAAQTAEPHLCPKNSGESCHGAHAAHAGARSVSFWSVHRWVESQIAGVDFPLVGTPAWCALADDDPRKLAAVLDGGQHWALRIEIGQEQRAQASRAVAGAADWPAMSRELRSRSNFRAAHPWARRAVFDE